MTIVLITVFVLGGLTIDTLNVLNLKTGIDMDPYITQVSRSLYADESICAIAIHLLSPLSIRLDEILMFSPCQI